MQWAVSTFTIVSSSSLKCLPEHQPHGGSDVQLAQSGCASQASSALTAAMRCTESAALRAIHISYLATNFSLKSERTNELTKTLVPARVPAQCLQVPAYDALSGAATPASAISRSDQTGKG